MISYIKIILTSKIINLELIESIKRKDKRRKSTVEISLIYNKQTKDKRSILLDPFIFKSLYEDNNLRDFYISFLYGFLGPYLQNIVFKTPVKHRDDCL